MAENKTKETTASVTEFLNAVPDETKRKDSFRLVQIMEEQTGLKAKMWGPAIVGFGSCHYRYESGREGDMPLVAFSPRKAEISLYLMQEPAEKEKLLAKLGKHKTGKGCTYIKKLEDINEGILRQMITSTIDYIKAKYGPQ
ncbi:DUF1801 domain-containing protein [Mucilaginibacter sp. RCC_168]|uniref:DUF1801 domain-containing protein n=1 Tax=Mucilaginibacter sp. RCC_168 TaxID=3239221 RepID=UPI0035268E78